MVDLRDRIKSRLQDIRKSARRASLDGGLTPDAIRNVLRSKSHNPRRDTLQGIACGLEWSLEELLELPSAGHMDPIETPIRRVPLISWTQAANFSEPAVPSLTSDAKDQIAVANSRTTLFALHVVDSAMTRVAPEGSIVIVDYGDKSLVPGRCYIVRHGNQAIFRRYRTDPVRLEPDSTDPHETIFIGHDMEVVGRVLQVINNLR